MKSIISYICVIALLASTTAHAAPGKITQVERAKAKVWNLVDEVSALEEQGKYDVAKVKVLKGIQAAEDFLLEREQKQGLTKEEQRLLTNAQIAKSDILAIEDGHLSGLLAQQAQGLEQSSVGAVIVGLLAILGIGYLLLFISIIISWG